MQFNIRGNKIEITDSIRSYIENKIGKLDKYLDDSENFTATVVVRVRGKEQIVEVTIPIKKVILRGEETHKDLYAAIDLVSEKIERQIRKNKTRLKKRVNHDDFNFSAFTEANDTDNDDKFIIVKRKEIDMKPMNEEEAILQMGLLDHDFFVFKDAESGKTCVLYRRKDNNYGIITTN